MPTQTQGRTPSSSSTREDEDDKRLERILLRCLDAKLDAFSARQKEFEERLEKRLGELIEERITPLDSAQATIQESLTDMRSRLDQLETQITEHTRDTGSPRMEVDSEWPPLAAAARPTPKSTARSHSVPSAARQPEQPRSGTVVIYPLASNCFRQERYKMTADLLTAFYPDGIPPGHKPIVKGHLSTSLHVSCPSLEEAKSFVEQFKDHEALSMAEARNGKLSMRIEMPPTDPALSRAMGQVISLLREWFHLDKLPENPTADRNSGNLFVGREHFGKVIVKGNRIAIQPDLKYAREHNFNYDTLRTAINETFNDV